jgi:hypothetical protein
LIKIINSLKKYDFVFAIGIMTLLLTATTAFGISSQFSKVMAQSDNSKDFKATLTGAAEVPPVQTKASGDATFELKSDGKTMDYAINVKSIDKVLYAHIHEGKDSVNGPIVVTLFNPSSPTGKIDGQLVNGTFGASTFEGSLKGKPMSDLLDLIKNKQAYVNVHTVQNPPGEIRGTVQ